MRFSRSTHLLMYLPIIRTGLPILAELIDLVNSVIFFLSQTTLLRWLSFLLGSQTVILSPALLDLFISFDASICYTKVFPPLGNSDHAVSVSIEFPSYSQQDVSFHCITYDYSRADWDGLCDHLRYVPWDNIFKLSASLAASEFCEWVEVGIDAYISHQKYHVKPHSSPWFSALCAAAIVHRNPFFRFYQKGKSSESKVKFRQASNHCKKVLEAAKLAYANKTKESISSQKLDSWDFWRIANSVLTKGKSAMPPLFNDQEVLSSASHKAKLFAENFSKNSNLDDSSISLLVLPSRTNLKLHISVTFKMVKKVVMKLHLSKTSGPDCIRVMVLKNCEPELSYILAELFNKCLKESCFLDRWKVSLLVAVLKNVGERSPAKNYRPASLLSVVSKVFDKIVNNKIVNHLEKCGLFSDFQYGSGSSRSTADLLTVASNIIARAFNRSGATQAVPLDISKVLIRFSMLVFFTNLSLMGFQVRYLAFFSFLNLNLIYEILLTKTRSGLLISMLGKLNWFCLLLM